MKLWKKVDSVVLRNFHDYWEDPLVNKYLCDDASKKFEGILILRKNKKPVWLSHPFNYEQAKKHFAQKAEVITYNSVDDIKKALRKNTGKVVGYNPKHQTVTSFKNLRRFLRWKRLVDVEDELEELREVKTTDEVEKITSAVCETRKVISLAKKLVYVGMTEKELDEKIRQQFDKDGFECAFTCVAFNQNTSHIHHSAGKTKLKHGPVLLDIGAKYKGYCADLSESFYFGGENLKANNKSTKTNQAFEKFYAEKEKVTECLANIESILTPGTSATQLWHATKPLGELPHALGHGIGIEVHDFPSGIGGKSKFTLKEGMVLAIEPAIYNKEFGIRIENDYLITKNGFRKLG